MKTFTGQGNADFGYISKFMVKRNAQDNSEKNFSNYVRLESKGQEKEKYNSFCLTKDH